MRVDAWSDIACPWCWLGKRHLEEAARRVGAPITIEMRSFELDPRAGPSIPARDYLERRFGSAERVDDAHARLRALEFAVGIRYDFDRALVANTFDAHRVHHRAKARGVGNAVVERFMRGYHGEGEDLADHATIRRLAVEAGLAETDADDVLASDAHADDVRADEAAAGEIGATGVPFFVVDGRYGVAGAQPVDVFARLLAPTPTGP